MTLAYSVRLWLLTTAVLFCFAPFASAVDIDWLAVGGAGNSCETQAQGCFGAVSYEFRIGKYEVTNTEYAEFLNAVAATDSNGLYNTAMGSGATFGGITRSGISGSFSYSVVAVRKDMPVNWVSFWDATRFANWLHNGQPIGAQDNTTTEDGAYTLTPTGITNNTVARNGGAQVFVTSEDEWYKAAYYDADALIYFDYPAGSNTQTTCALAGATANTANCQTSIGNPSNVGSYSASASPTGTFDQGGNVWEWNEAIIATDRGLRGGNFFFDSSRLAASSRIGVAPASEDGGMGFRVASSSPIAVPALNPLGIAILLSLIGASAYWRLRGLPSQS